MKAFRVHQSNGQIRSILEDIALDSVSDGEVVINAAYSSINYKDALAVTGKGKILKKFPLVAGIDVAGEVYSSTNPRIKKGDSVLVTGCGLGESHDGGYAEQVRVPADWVVPLPKGLSLKEAMILGTAGFSAGLALERLIHNGLKPENGAVVVTGASGGVGVLSVQILNKLGFEVVAVSGKPHFHESLRKFGARQVMTPEALALGSRPLESARFAAAIDNVGGDLLSRLMAHIHLWGSIACIGLAASAELHTTVMPIILRGVSLLGISSNNCPFPLRQKIWTNLGSVWKPQNLPELQSDELFLSKLKLEFFEELTNRHSVGRKIINCRK